jgi:hypothetical protein
MKSTISFALLCATVVGVSPALAVSGIAILVRLVWVLPDAYLPLGRDEALPEHALAPVLAEYSSRLRAVDPLDHSQETDQIHRLRLTALNAERRELIALWRDHRIGDEVLHRIERKLDLEESRLKG